ncbi:GPI ethanolamine phosphate transferase 1-like [Drosophila miranda]|uniref:GPI ethanolamine phosphate transferase 1-like n=1 Tax=Drosophila miranda TaxID=7229 RepID=UPI0007E6978C|nr:GPI ethanolamine phosphate transferase 1-like [Drosophila miranda]
MWELQVIVVHILLIGCFMNIYFQSTILEELEPQKTLPEFGLRPPADRLVVFLIDGLRAESFFANNCKGVPHLQKLFLKQGVVGISRGCAPTMTRPGHIAIFAGFNEDPQAAITNFEWNPTRFDSIFNRSRHAIGWLDKTVSDFFARSGGAPLRFETYRYSDFSRRFKTDTWVYNKAREFLTNNESIRELQNATAVVFLVYLLDIDKAGHVFTPLHREYQKRLYLTQKRIRETYDLFENAFNNSRTAYLMTSDHGMSDVGHHGGGSDMEIEMPFFFWGAGVKHLGPPGSQLNFTVNAHGLQMPLQELEQIQLAPLMSALIGLPPPTNNRAPLPLGYLNVSEEYERQALFLNVLQFMAQAQIMIRRHEQSFFHKWLPKYKHLDSRRIASLPSEVNRLVAAGHDRKAVKLLRQASWQARECLEFYQSYYNIPLLVALTASYFGLFYCLTVMLTRECTESKQRKKGLVTWMTLLMAILGLVLGYVLFLQRVPWYTEFYLLLPIGIWTMALAERPLHGKSIPFPFTLFIWTVIPAGLVITTSFTSTHVGLLYAAVVCGYNRRGFLRPTGKFFIWLTAMLLPSAFLVVTQNFSLEWILDAIDLDLDSYVLAFSMFLAVLLPWILGHKFVEHVWMINSGILLMGVYGTYLYENNLEINLFLRTAFWAFLAYAFVSLPYSKEKTPRKRFNLITFNLVAVHALLCVSTGSLFLQMMITEFLLRQEIHAKVTKKPKNEIRGPLDRLKLNYHYAVLILFYFFVSFFGSGHWALGFAFRATTGRLLISSFTPFIITILIIAKIMIPSIIFISGIYTLSPYARMNTRAIFNCMFLISDAMGLFFCLYIQNRGNWRQVRRSLDHVLLTNLVVILLLASSCLTKTFLMPIKRAKPESITEVKGGDVIVLTSAGSAEESKAVGVSFV